MSAAKNYADAVKQQAKAEKALAAAHEAWGTANEPSVRLRCRLATEAAEKQLQARIFEVESAHALYWNARAAELRPALEELALVAGRYEVMMHAAGDLTVQPWLQTVRGVLAQPLPPHVLGSLVTDVPLLPERCEEFDCPENVYNDRTKLAKAEKALAKGRKWL
ncbi:hypothetical protein [Hydrogenophaga sp.]|uniref:hypothetical protein n=1 Tax=Hydrogenophaga sp. TaxID=1904254 RepID=UPI0027172545|nr:hypothetical protein [Hydrogenophaga sp.]MDO9438556.1 hypothetical protein [Hydrogenophaga sp.]